jgi:hypothetical protein
VRFENEITRCTALHLACQEGFDEICGVLLAHGTNANTVRLSDGALFEQCVGKRVVCGLRRWRSRVRCDAVRLRCNSRLGDVGRHDRAFIASQMVALPSWYWRPWAGTWTACKDCSCEVHRPKLSKLPRICQARIEMTVLMRMTTTKMRKMQCP